MWKCGSGHPWSQSLRFDHRTLFEALCVWSSAPGSMVLVVPTCKRTWFVNGLFMFVLFYCCHISAICAQLETNFVQGHPIVHGDGQAYVWPLVFHSAVRSGE